MTVAPVEARRPRKPWPIVRKVWITAGLGATIVFVSWSLIAYRASSEARRATASDELVRVDYASGVWAFAPIHPCDGAARLVFFPGALVDPRAYAPLAQAVARAGYPAAIVAIPRRAAFGGAQSAELARRVQASLSSEGGRAIVVGGHSRGGVIASQVVADFGSLVHGLVLIGTSHPRDVDLSRVPMPVTKIVGTRDGLASPAEVQANARLLPEQTRWVWIEGGNHSQFGWYGFQPLDKLPQASAPEQRRIMIEAVLHLLRSVSASEGLSDPDLVAGIATENFGHSDALALSERPMSAHILGSIQTWQRRVPLRDSDQKTMGHLR